MAGETILIVEDEWIISINLQNMLKELGYNVLEPVTSGEDAIQAVSARQPDLILMDIQLSGQMNGIEAAQHIGAISDSPIIFLSSHSKDAFVQDAKTALPYGYLIKPVFARELAVTIEIALNRYLLDRCTRESEERFRNLFQNLTSVAVQGYGMDGTTRYWNQASQDIYGYTAQETIGRNLMELIIPSEMQSDVEQAIQRMAETGEAIPASELSLKRKDGSRVSVFSSHTVLKSSGRAPEFFCIDIDLTECKRIEKEKAALEDQNRQLQKAESLGRMAGAIAHHFNNIIGAAIGNLDLAIMDTPASGPVENLTEAMKACCRAAEISSLLLAYLGQTHGEIEPLDLSATCLHGLSMLQFILPNMVTVEPEFPIPGPTIRANTNQIHQVLTNLVTNACESICDKPGAIKLTVKKVLSANITGLHRFPVDWQPQNTSYACLEVRDTGCGIADRDIEKIFDPFFTTKFTGRGMGLPVIVGIVRTHNGAVTVESAVGRGSVFQVFFPMSTETIPFQQEKTVPISKTERTDTVLVIEDEEQVRNMIKIMLARLGYSVLEAKDGVEAVEIFKFHQDNIRCILSDLTMPHMDGWETMAALRKLSPDIPVILSSGYNETQVMAETHPERPNAFLGKPYRIGELDSTMRRVLSA